MDIAALDLDRRLQNFEKVVHEMVDALGRGIPEEVRNEWHRLLRSTEPLPDDSVSPPAPLDTAAQLAAAQAEIAALKAAQAPTPAEGVDPTNPPKSSTEDSANLEAKIVAPDTSQDGTSDTPSETTPPTESSSSRTSDTPTETSSDAAAATTDATPPSQ